MKFCAEIVETFRNAQILKNAFDGGGGVGGFGTVGDFVEKIVSIVQALFPFHIDQAYIIFLIANWECKSFTFTY